MDNEPSENPYAPPGETSDGYDLVAREGGSLSVSGQGWEIVAGLSKWMRIVSTLQYVIGALLAVLLLILIFAGRMILRRSLGGSAFLGTSLLLLLGTTLLLFFGATWLRQAATHFYDGVLSDAERPLAHGFRKLRLYLILYGIFGVISLVTDVVKLVIIKWH
jgi:hypothetical protein